MVDEYTPRGAEAAPALRVRALRKAFDRPAVDDLNLEIPTGTTVALLGPNGAGKSTTISIMLGLLEPTSGEARTLGAALSEGDNPLTGREREVLQASTEVATATEIAERLTLSEGTVRNHLSTAIQKLGARNRAEAARVAREKGWLDPSR